MATGEQQPNLRIVLVGKTGAGKSATGNNILDKETFHKEDSSTSVTKICKMDANTFNGYNLVVVDTPGWYDSNLSEAEIVQETIRCIDMSYPGPHVFLLVVPIGQFTDKEVKTVQMIQKVFGEEATKYMMILFTRGDDLEDRGIDDYLASAKSELQSLVDKCERRYHVFNNKEQSSRNQVHSLLIKIQEMVQNNGGSCYTNITYQLLDIYKKREAEIRKKIRRIQREMQMKEAEYQWKVALMQQEQERQKLKEAELRGQLLESEIKRACEEAILAEALEDMRAELVQEEQRRKHAEEAQQILEITHFQNFTDQEKLCELDHQGKIQQEKQKKEKKPLTHEDFMEKEQMKVEVSKNKQGMEEERQRIENELTDTLQEYKEKMTELVHQGKQLNTEKEDCLRKSIRRNVCCSIL